MIHVETPNGYLVIERIGGMDVYIDDFLVCELNGNLSYYKKDEKIDYEALEDAIDEELDTLEVLEELNDPYNFV